MVSGVIMSTKWILDNYVLENSYHDDIADLARKTGIEFVIDSYQHFKEKPDNTHFQNGDCVVSYGSIPFVEQYTKGRNFTPGAYLQKKNLECTGYIPNIPSNFLLNEDHVFATFGDFARRKDFFYNLFNTDCLFIRPNCGLKTFSGLPIHINDFDHELNSLNQLTSVTDSTLILISSCKPIRKEYRYFIGNRNILSSSLYKENDELSIKKEQNSDADNLMNEIIRQTWQPDIVYVCDIGIVHNEPKIIEFNSFSCSGFYDADIEKILSSVSEIALLEYNGDITL